MSALVEVSGCFVREQLRAPLTLVLLVAIPAFFVLIFSVLGEFATALGGTLASQSATAISAGWAAAFPECGPARMMLDGAFSASFHTGSALLGALVWLVVLAPGVSLALRRAIGTHARRDARPAASAAPL